MQINLVKFGDKVVFKPGEVVPVNEKIIDGQTAMDENTRNDICMKIAIFTWE